MTGKLKLVLIVTCLIHLGATLDPMANPVEDFVLDSDQNTQSTNGSVNSMIDSIPQSSNVPSKDDKVLRNIGLNFYIPSDACRQLLGFEGRLYYVQSGVAMERALSTNFFVSSDINQLKFAFFARLPVLYEVSVSVVNDSFGVLDYSLLGADRDNTIHHHALPEIVTSVFLNISCNFLRLKELVTLEKKKSSYVYSVFIRMNFTFAPHGRNVGDTRSIYLYRIKQCSLQSSMGAVIVDGGSSRGGAYNGQSIGGSLIESGTTSGAVKWSSVKIFVISIFATIIFVIVSTLITCFYHLQSVKPSLMQWLSADGKTRWKQPQQQHQRIALIPTQQTSSVHSRASTPYGHQAANPSTPNATMNNPATAAPLYHSSHSHLPTTATALFEDPRRTNNSPHPHQSMGEDASYKNFNVMFHNGANAIPDAAMYKSNPALLGSGTIVQKTYNNNSPLVGPSGSSNPDDTPREVHSLHGQYEAASNDIQLTFNEIVLQGTFGVVHNASMLDNKNKHHSADKQSPNVTQVMVKTVTEHASKHHIETMLRECNVFNVISAPPNEQCIHVMPYIAIISSPILPRAPVVIYPQTSCGILKLYLRQLRQNRQSLTTRDVVGMGIQILKGLQFIVKRKMEFNDLATRNCFLDDNWVVKIGDAALARDLFPEDYQCLGDNVNRPIKWLAIEAISKYIYSPANDIWSFGITLWEIWTLAEQPYEEIDPFEMVSFLKEGGRLYQPQNCPDALYRCMCSCWAHDPVERPNISKLLKYLQDFHHTLGAFL